MTNVGLGLAMLLIGIAAAHILEETIAGFTSFFNTQWFSGNSGCPVTAFKGIYIDKVGLFLVVSATSLLAVYFDSRLLLVPLGIILADCIQHSAFSIAKRGYTPGSVTSVLYVVFLIYYFGRFGAPKGSLSWIALLFGVGFIVINYLLASITVRQGRCSDLAK